MNNYFLELFKENNTVIIPGLGALSVTDRVRGEYMFMSYLKHNDGLLRNFISTADGISTEQAQEKIDLFVTQLNEQLRSGGRVAIAGLGSFFVNSSRDVDFDSSAVSDHEEKRLEVQEIAPVIEEETVLNDTESVQDEITEERVTEEPIQEEQVTVENPENEEECKEDLIAEPLAAAPVVEESVRIESVSNENSKEVYSEQQQWDDDLDLPPIDAKIERPKKPIIEKAEFDKKKNKTVKAILIAFAAALVVGAVPTFIYFDEIKAKIFGPKEGITELASEKQFEFEESGKEDSAHYLGQVDDEVQDSVANEVTPEPVEVVNEPVQATPEQNPQMESNQANSGAFQLIVGSFQNQTYAANFEKKMRAEGNTNAAVFGPVGGFYLVSLGAYDSEQEAKSALAQKVSSYPKIWIYKGKSN